MKIIVDRKQLVAALRNALRFASRSCYHFAALYPYLNRRKNRIGYALATASDAAQDAPDYAVALPLVSIDGAREYAADPDDFPVIAFDAIYLKKVLASEAFEDETLVTFEACADGEKFVVAGFHDAAPLKLTRYSVLVDFRFDVYADRVQLPADADGYFGSCRVGDLADALELATRFSGKKGKYGRSNPCEFVDFFADADELLVAGTDGATLAVQKIGVDRSFDRKTAFSPSFDLRADVATAFLRTIRNVKPSRLVRIVRIGSDVIFSVDSDATLEAFAFRNSRRAGDCSARLLYESIVEKAVPTGETFWVSPAFLKDEHKKIKESYVKLTYNPGAEYARLQITDSWQIRSLDPDFDTRADVDELFYANQFDHWGGVFQFRSELLDLIAACGYDDRLDPRALSSLRNVNWDKRIVCVATNIREDRVLYATLGD